LGTYGVDVVAHQLPVGKVVVVGGEEACQQLTGFVVGQGPRI